MTDDESTRSVATGDPRLGASWLLVFAASGSVQAFPIPEQGVLRIGRSRTSDILLDDRSVSREHAMLMFQPNGTVLIRNVEASNGVRVGGRLLQPGESAAMSAGEIVRLGGVLVALQQGSAFVSSGTTGAARRLPALERAAREPADRGFVAADPAMLAVLRLVERVAPSTISVLVTGETGAGKEIVANAIHRCSSRGDRPFVRVNCAALSPSLVESELFGHARGAFTDAKRDKPGLLEAAEGGTLFLDEVGELSLDAQAKLLRVLEQREVLRVGETTPREIDVRFVAATNRDPKSLVAERRFRDDVYYRLNGISIEVPPLRERPLDIDALVRHFLPAGAEVDPGALAAIHAYGWPGNVRELKNAVERGWLIAEGGRIGITHLPVEVTGVAPASPQDALATAVDAPATVVLRDRMKQFERQRIVDALDECSGNQTRAAALLGISRRTLIARLDEYDIPRPRKR